MTDTSAASAPNSDIPWPVLAARAADDKLGRDTIILDVGDVLAITDYFIITSGGNARQVKAIVDEVQFQLKNAGGPTARRIEGQEGGEWVLADFGEFVLHVFGTDARDYYKLDRLWGDRPSLAWRDEGAAQA